MQFVLTSIIKNMKKQYSITGYPQLTGTANLTFKLFPLKICINYPSHSLTLQQKGGLWHILFGFFPIISPSRLFPLTITKDGELIGHSEKKSGDTAFYFHIGATCYELRGHTDDKFSICKDDIQIAVIQKEHYSYAEQNTYQVLTSEKALEDVAYLFMLCMYIDCRFYRSQDNFFAMMKWEKTYVFHDLYKERAEWIPQQVGLSERKYRI